MPAIMSETMNFSKYNILPGNESINLAVQIKLLPIMRKSVH